MLQHRPLLHPSQENVLHPELQVTAEGLFLFSFFGAAWKEGNQSNADDDVKFI